MAGALVDVESGATFGRAEARRRFDDHWKLLLVARGFLVRDEADPFYWFRRDHYGQASIGYHF